VNVSTSGWFQELLGVSDLLAAEDRVHVTSWREDGTGPEGGEVAGADEDPPLTLRLAALGRAYVKHFDKLTPLQRGRIGGVLDRVLAAGPQDARDAVATGFLEALLNAWDEGFDLEAAWPGLGPESRKYCVAWNSFTGVDSPAWLRVK
jgi:hypothetical protein